MRKRTWYYVQKPAEYEIHCDKCGGSNLEWSEYAGKVWCYDCQIDTAGDEGIFNGPIGWEVSQMMGISFARYNMKKQRVEHPRIVGNKIRYYVKPE
jgi:hypothetical protein